MSAAGFVLAINLFIAGLFATAFGIVAAYYRGAIGARWLALGYGLGIANGALEFILPYQTDARPVSFAIFAVFLSALTLCNIGIARHYGVRPPWLVLGGLYVGALVVNLLILDMPRDSLLRGMLYQAPYALMHLVGIKIILSRQSNRALDMALLALFGLSAANFVTKPFLAVMLGSGGSPQGYLGSSYAAISQSTGAVLLISNGLLMLLIIVRDMIADMTARSETDPLSGLLNRRGFEDQADRARLLAVRAGAPAVMVVADLDHFKRINDSYGHAAGDQAIAAFGRVLKESFDFRAVIGRLGGEEFAVLLPGADLGVARGAAETARRLLRELSSQERGLEQQITSSFGIAAMEPGESLADLLRRADTALYEAKSRGRDRVCVAPVTAVGISRDGPEQQARA
ncbi:diguanylate cyclase [Devosia sp.]|uniref:GGDEF domain-containing protein n=1 Tax=Devosia sp. TaxID=1871048 RepID=UPI0025CF1490|nr:GGDEF domain-containing protein [Devosia sp.]MCR6635383.1 GGDEF domain-containing protein [Devosia sp.]